MKKLLYILCAAVLAAGCSDDDASSYYLDELVIDTANCLAEGSYVQGVEANDLCRIKIPYENAKGGTARISAPETNGLRIDAQEVTLVSGAGEATVAVKGTPLLLETSFLQLNVEYRAKTYLSSVEIAVLEDVDPSGTIEFEIDRTPLTGLTAPETIAFTVSPTMAAVVESGTTPDGLRVNVVSDPATGEGTVTFTPAANFLGGEVELTASFGARPPQVCKIRVSAFAAGEGTADAPYEVTSAAELEKIGYGFDKAFRLASDIVLDNNWTPAGTEAQPFTGSLDGNGRKITLALDRPAEDYVALFARVGAGAEVTNLTLDGSVTGRNYVSALAAESEASLSADVSAVTVKGENFVAASVASGAGRDARVIEFGTVPAAVNITMGSDSATESLGLVTKGATVTFDPGATGTSWSYDDASGNFTVTKEADFSGGDVTFSVSLGDRVTSTVHTIAVSSKNMYESGSGIEGDPYVVIDADQFTATLHTYPAAHVKLTEDIAVSDWETIPAFSGSLDGGGHTVEGLTAPFVATLTGAVKNVKFSGVNISAGKSACGAVANLLDGHVEGVAVTGTLSAESGASSADTGFGAIAGQAQGSSVINNCYVNVTMTTNSNFATGGLVGVIKASNGVTMSDSTVEGSISGTISGTKLGGILGRKTNTNQNSKDIIKGCLVTAEVKMSGEGSNMIGGIFGALQGSTVSGDYVGGITIEKSAFTGSVSGGNAVGGIGGVCCSVRDCYVGGSVQAISVSSSSTAAAAGISAAVKGDVERCVVCGARVTGGPKGTSYTAGIVNVKNGNTPKTTGCAVIATTIQTGGFAIYGTASGDITATSNYRWNVSYADASAYVALDTDTYGQDGVEQEPTQALFESLGYDFASVWIWDAAASAPKLQKTGCDDAVKIN
ncbi:hypothetical protein [Alistipes senegalensis]|uniref:hypothetical protein n=1 Tax=Alistipes senegalensis TaxID=1288121 RepID=UPI00248DCFA5|nr:hypothetical protein [Alistipes senegalensis]